MYEFGLCVIGCGIAGAGVWFVVALAFFLLNREEQDGW